jgi:hypothetical protein
MHIGQEDGGLQYMRKIATGCLENGFQVFHNLMRLIGQGSIVQLSGRRIDADLSGNVEQVAVSDGLVVWTDGGRSLVGSYDGFCHGKQKSLKLALSPFFAKNCSMQVLVGEANFITKRLGVDELSTLAAWQVTSAKNPLPSARVYLDLSGCFATNRPENTPSDAWWIVHAPAYTLDELPPNTIRLNAWPGFAAGKDWELAWAGEEAGHVANEVCASLDKNPIQVPDQIGFVGARVLASIIHEAMLLKAEGAASETDIDLAMKLGTNYPKGPFEWGEEIGWNEVMSLLEKMGVK